ncbi:hypothetical protein [Sinomicrobium sp. M5D2P9]
MGILSFLEANSQNNNEKLTAELKATFREELKSDSEKEFNSEFIRTTNLENKIINKYGFEGVKLVFESRNSSNFYQLGAFPKDCPWFNRNNKTIAEFITENFQPISKKNPNLMSALKNRCKFIYAEKRENDWYLHYLLEMKLYDGRDYFTVFTGGAPLLNPVPNRNLKTYYWGVPKDLKALYAIHNGFGASHYGNYYVMENQHLKVMAELMDPICEGENIAPPQGYTFSDLLEFCPDGAGNAQCFYKNNSNVTVDWDHETWEILGEIGFFEFIDEILSEIDEQ